MSNSELDEEKWTGCPWKEIIRWMKKKRMGWLWKEIIPFTTSRHDTQT